MSYSFNLEDEVLVVKVNVKRATVEFAGALKEELISRIDQGSKNVLVDLSEANFVDSSFIGTLVAGLKKATMKNGDLKIVGLQDPVRAMFELTRLNRIFDIFDKTEEAIKSF